MAPRFRSHRAWRVASSLLILVLLLLLAFPAAAKSTAYVPYPFKDINPATGGSAPRILGESAGILYFGALKDTGSALYKIPAPGAEPELIKTFGSAVAFSFSSEAVDFIGQLYFVAYENGYGRELWSTNGTPEGTVMVKDIAAGTENADPKYLTWGTSALSFVATDSEHGTELWYTNGFGPGTFLASDLCPGPGSSNPHALALYHGYTFFAADDCTNGEGLWYIPSPGNPPELVKDLGSDHIQEIAIANDKIIFTVELTGINRTQLWVSDGTPSGTMEVMGNNFSSVFDLEALGDLVFFSANSTNSSGVSENGLELWKTDGTSSGTSMVTDIEPGSASSSPGQLKAYNGWLYFTATTATTGTDLWAADSSGTGVSLLADLQPGSDDPTIGNMTGAGGSLYFTLTIDDIVRLFRAGTPSESIQYVDGIFIRIYGSMSPVSMAAAQDRLYISASSPSTMSEVFVVDNGIATQAAELNKAPQGSEPNNFFKVGDELVFTAYQEGTGYELWKSDGSTAGTEIVSESVGGPDDKHSKLGVVLGDTFLYYRGDLQFGAELWSYTPGSLPQLVKDIEPGRDSSEISEFEVFNNQAFFVAGNLEYGAELWKTNGTMAGTQLVKDLMPGAGMSSYPHSLTVAGNTLYFVAGTPENGKELWKTDGTPGGTQLVKDIYPGTGDSSPEKLVNLGGTLYFRAEDAEHGMELWKSDGTPAGTQMVEDLYPGADSSNPFLLTPYGGDLYFAVMNADAMIELWKTDGTLAGSVPLKTLTNIADLTAAGDRLYFVGDEASGSGEELWTTNGTPAGTQLVKDIRPGTASSSPGYLFASGNKIFFAANDVVHGVELWVSDGTEAGTELVGDLVPGVADSDPIPLIEYKDFLLFSANLPATGNELYFISMVENRYVVNLPTLRR